MRNQGFKIICWSSEYSQQIVAWLSLNGLLQNLISRLGNSSAMQTSQEQVVPVSRSYSYAIFDIDSPIQPQLSSFTLPSWTQMCYSNNRSELKTFSKRNISLNKTSIHFMVMFSKMSNLVLLFTDIVLPILQKNTIWRILSLLQMRHNSFKPLPEHVVYLFKSLK